MSRKLLEVEGLLSHCKMCGWGCGVDRLKGERGVCDIGRGGEVYRHGIQMGEEIGLVPSYIVDFSGCQLGCVYCSERCFWERGKEIPIESLACEIVKGCREYNARSIQFVGGEPVLHLWSIVRLVEVIRGDYGLGVPFYLNSNGYFSEGVMVILEGVVDGFVFDLKVAPGCEGMLGGVGGDYHGFVLRRLEESYQKWDHKCIYVRHLVIPGHSRCCTLWVLEWLKAHMLGVHVNVMTSFVNFQSGEMLSDEERSFVEAMLRW